MAQRIAEISRGQFATVDSRGTVETFLRAWLDARDGEISPTTLARYRELSERQIIPTLGCVQLNKLTRHHVQDAIRKWRAMPKGGKRKGVLSERTVFHCFATLRSALYSAQRDGLIASNPCVSIDVGKGCSYVNALDETQALQLVRGLAGSELCAPTLFAILTGLRRGELLALRWSDIDFPRRMLHVRRSLEVVGAADLRFKVPKTAKSMRSVSLPQQAIDLLKQQRKAQDEHKQLHERAYHDSDLIFCHHNGEPWNPRRFSSKFHATVKRLKLPKVSVHGLRHSFASLQLLAGTDLKVVSHLLGHSSVTITGDVYAHVLGGLQTDAAQRMERLLGRVDAAEFATNPPPKRLRLVKNVA
jgi:integrase